MASSRASKGSAEFLHTKQWRVIRLRSHAIGKPRRTGVSESVTKKVATYFRHGNSRVILHVPYCVTGFMQKKSNHFSRTFKGPPTRNIISDCTKMHIPSLF